MNVELSRAQIYFLNEVLLHEWYHLKEDENRDILMPFLDTISEAIPYVQQYDSWDEFLEEVRVAQGQEAQS